MSSSSCIVTCRASPDVYTYIHQAQVFTREQFLNTATTTKDVSVQIFEICRCHGHMDISTKQEIRNTVAGIYGASVVRQIIAGNTERHGR